MDLTNTIQIKVMSNDCSEFETFLPKPSSKDLAHLFDRSAAFGGGSVGFRLENCTSFFKNFLGGIHRKGTVEGWGDGSESEHQEAKTREECACYQDVMYGQSSPPRSHKHRPRSSHRKEALRLSVGSFHLPCFWICRGVCQLFLVWCKFH